MKPMPTISPASLIANAIPSMESGDSPSTSSFKSAILPFTGYRKARLGPMTSVLSPAPPHNLSEIVEAETGTRHGSGEHSEIHQLCFFRPEEGMVGRIARQRRYSRNLRTIVDDVRPVAESEDTWVGGAAEIADVGGTSVLVPKNHVRAGDEGRDHGIGTASGHARGFAFVIHGECLADGVAGERLQVRKSDALGPQTTAW